MTRRKTVLVVTSSYAPAMMADMHRARQLAWELPVHGWNVEVLAPDAWYQFANSLDRDSDAFFCPSTPVHYAPPPGPILRRLIRSSTIGWRALVPLDAAAGRLFGKRKYDLVYFSTTQFNLFLLGRRWRARYGIPYLLDIQDPIYRPLPAGGIPGAAGIKRSLNGLILQRIESRALRSASGLVSVSARYLDTLRDRHGRDLAGWIPPHRQAVIPFAGSERDLIEAKSRLPAREQPPAGARRVVYVGVGGFVMARAFATFCREIRQAIDRGELDSGKLRVELYGTMFTWRDGDRKDLSEIAAQAGIGDHVFEDPRRVSYRKALELLLGADGALILGVDGDGYMPSKLYTYALSGKALIAVLRRRSEGAAAFERTPEVGHLMTFDDGEGSTPANSAALRAFLGQVIAGSSIDRKAAVEDHLAPAMARAHAELFEACASGIAAPVAGQS